MKRTPHKNRPRWAKPLTAAMWKALHDCQGKVPTLSQLRADVRWQEEKGIVCHTCQQALRLLGATPAWKRAA